MLRHLDESQRSMVAAKIANLDVGRPAETAPIGAITQDSAAEMLNVGRRSVQRAREVLDRQKRGRPKAAPNSDSGKRLGCALLFQRCL